MRVLENVFAAKPKTLDGSTRSDLLNFFVTGKERMLTYVKLKFLVPPIEPAKKSKQHKLHTFSKPSQTKRQQGNRVK